MPQDKQSLAVWLSGEWVGVLQQTPTGSMQFTYLPQASQALSIGMPIRSEPYNDVRSEAYFGGLLPESAMARKAIGQRYGINPHNSFGVLRAIGYDCAGAVSLHPLHETVSAQAAQPFPLSGKALSEEALYHHIQELPQKPLFLGAEGLRLSLAGAQDKAAVCVIDNEIALPQAGCPTTHILKPVMPGVDGIIHNEYACLKLAQRVCGSMGLKVPHAEIRWAQQTPYLLIERYDRVIASGHVQRIHQEDFCQALGIISANKYQREGGPDFTACFDLLRATTRPVKDRNAMAALMAFNYLIANCDAHGKNVSLLHHPQSQIAMAPAYDLICTQVYPHLAQTMAMKIGGYYEPDRIFARHWQRQCRQMGYSYPALRETLYKQARLLPDALQAEKANMQERNVFDPVLDEMARVIEARCQQTIQRLETGD
ncbi:MAG: type II toxin-antitoxin system HipA family toxin [Vampirovibrionales bacterium]|nr:type II toxin-antitoxin system HipA family toxin [Vampirovibrionales bacterium]